MELTKTCPYCNKIQKYSRIDLLRNAIKNNTPCNSCKQIGERNHFYGKKHNEETKKIMSIKNLNRSDDINKKISKALKNRIITQEQREKISKTLLGRFKGELNPNFGKKYTIEERKEISRRTIESYYGTGKYEKYMESLPEYKKYKKLVWRITNQNDLTTLENHEKRGSHRKDKKSYHLDHIFPISQGYFYNIDPNLIGDIKNLRFIPWLENVSKNCYISIIPEHIKEEYEKRKKSY
jgi:hypothetical protein